MEKLDDIEIKWKKSYYRYKPFCPISKFVSMKKI
jgi:hypothetical protein